MKKMFLILVVACSVVACNNESSNTEEPINDTLPTTTDTIKAPVTSDTVSPDNSPNMMTDPGTEKPIKINDTLNRRPHQ